MNTTKHWPACFTRFAIALGLLGMLKGAQADEGFWRSSSHSAMASSIRPGSEQSAIAGNGSDLRLAPLLTDRFDGGAIADSLRQGRKRVNVRPDVATWIVDQGVESPIVPEVLKRQGIVRP